MHLEHIKEGDGNLDRGSMDDERPPFGLQGFETDEPSWDWGLVARTENGHLLDYKVVIVEKYKLYEMLSCLIYSSETGLWSLETLHIPHSFLMRFPRYPISLNGNLHWFGLSTDRQRVLLSMDIYSTTSTGSVRCRVTPFPDLEKNTKFIRVCTPCQGFLMYMNIVSVTKVDGSLDNKLCVWRLKSEGWQLMSEISADFIFTDEFDYLPVTINPFDA
ncbi:unnamed protein product [Eruca vesicaria subsp. sativa]|uniref:F-box protein At3g26010-like beta-propeller domain-containing protein n=1 Tax=Eruca vesicaria subsp. sativa TaxID=29727 RepID=A0ABC8LN11_ERUVS|nr:unnamed protein product [Eruca vesicaria subsp. sativa]